MSNKSPISDDELEGLLGHLAQTPLALAVSGGADSMALMHMVARWARQQRVRAAWAKVWYSELQAGEDGPPDKGVMRHSWYGSVTSIDDLRRTGGPPHVVVMTVDHGLRAEAAEEAAFVAREAEMLGLPCQVLRWVGDKPTTGIQAAAREARRTLLVDAVRAESQWLANLLHTRSVRPQRTLVMAHHQEDQAETFVMRLARGSGLEGLGCMQELDWISSRPPTESTVLHRDSICVERPLLGVAKARLVAWLVSQGGRWIEDASNQDQRFERVRVRKMMPLLAELGLSAEKIALSARRLREAESDFRFVMDCDELVDRRPAFWHGGLMCEVDLDARNPFFCGTYVATRSLRQILRGLGGGARDAELAQVENLLLIRRGEQRPAAVTLAGCRIEFLDDVGTRLRIYREGSGEGLPEVAITPGDIVTWDGGRFEVAAMRGARSLAVVRALGMQGWGELKKAVPRLAELKWPAAAAATLPVIAAGGVVVAYPGVACVLDSVKQVPPAVRTDWAAFIGPAEPIYRAQFDYVWW